MWWQEKLQKIGRLDAHAAQIGQPGAPAFAVQFLDAAEEALDPDQILLRVPTGVFNEERGVAATKLDFERLRFWKQFCQLHPFDDGRKFDDEIFRLRFQIVNRQSQIVNEKMVGAVRFELTTSCTRNKRATRLRYAPTARNTAC